MEINEKVVRKLGKLSRIAISDSEVENVANKLKGILDWVSQLEDVNTENVEPMYSIQFDKLPMRNDEVIPFGTHEEVMKNAPATDNNKEYFAVPKVVK